MEHGGGAVRVMTVHGAKGLESAVVILPDTFQTPDHERRGNILYTDNCVFFGVPKRLECEAVADAKTAAHDRQMREYRRLLYVAATRARDMLIVGGYQAGNRKEPAPDSWYALLHAAGRKIGAPEEVDGESIIVVGSPLTVSAPIPELPSGTSLPQFLQRPAKPERVPPLLRPSRIPGAEEPPAISPVTRAPQRYQRGLLIHALLAKLPEIARNDREAAGYTYLKRRGIAASEAQSLMSETQKILDDSHFAPLFNSTSRAEVAITARLPEIGGAQISGQIDRLVVTPDSVLIADFKTNRLTPATTDEVPRLYIAQMALYRAALEKIYPGKSVACALIWTETAKLMPLPEELLDREMRTLAANTASISAT
jgi:ATP-dependent helicase/nuclease subunit A